MPFADKNLFCRPQTARYHVIGNT